MTRLILRLEGRWNFAKIRLRAVGLWRGIRNARKCGRIRVRCARKIASRRRRSWRCPRTASGKCACTRIFVRYIVLKASRDAAPMASTTAWRRWARRIADLKRDARFKYVTVFKNQGAQAGEEWPHAHSQITATTFVPRRILY